MYNEKLVCTQHKACLPVPSEQATERRSLNPNAQPFVPSAASLLNLNASGTPPINQPINSNVPINQPINSDVPINQPINSIATIAQPNNSTTLIPPSVNSIASSAQLNNPTAESSQQFSGMHIKPASQPPLQAFY